MRGVGFFGTMPASAAARRRWSVAARVFAACVGGYACVSLLTLALPSALAPFGVNRAEALLAVTTISFLVHAGTIMAVFHARSAVRAWIGLVMASAFFIGIFLLLPGYPA